MLFVIQYKPARENFLKTITPEEGEVVGTHFAYLSELHEKKILLMAGRRDDGAFGIAVIEARSETEAKALLADDPVVEKGVFQATIGEFRVALGQFA